MIDTFRKILGMPVLASENGHDIDALIVYIHWLMIALFIGWFAYFLYCLFRFRASRNARADHIGARTHASTWIELVVAGVEAVLLVAFAIPMWARAADVTKFTEKDRADATEIQVIGQQFNWNVRYPGADKKFGKQSMQLVNEQNLFGVDPDDPAGADDIQIVPAAEIHVPVNKPVIAYISSKDVIHSFKIIAMRVTQDAIPGLRIPAWFKPTQEGRYQINCAQLCGNGHTSMSGGFIIVESQEKFDAWMAEKAKASAGGAQSFE